MAPNPHQAVLLTSRLRLVPLSDAHIELEFALDSDAEVMKFLGSGKPRTRSEIQDLHQGRMARAAAAPGFGFWVGFLRDDKDGGLSVDSADDRGVFVGWWILDQSNKAHRAVDKDQAELGYRLVRRFWRQGLAKEGALELLRHGFQDLGLQRIFAETMSVNVASRATMQSVGLRYVRTFHLNFEDPIPGTEEGEVEYALTKEAWTAQAALQSSLRQTTAHE